MPHAVVFFYWIKATLTSGLQPQLGNLDPFWFWLFPSKSCIYPQPCHMDNLKPYVQSVKLSNSWCEGLETVLRQQFGPVAYDVALQTLFHLFFCWNIIWRNKKFRHLEDCSDCDYEDLCFVPVHMFIFWPVLLQKSYFCLVLPGGLIVVWKDVSLKVNALTFVVFFVPSRHHVFQGASVRCLHKGGTEQSRGRRGRSDQPRRSLLRLLSKRRWWNQRGRR